MGTVETQPAPEKKMTNLAAVITANNDANYDYNETKYLFLVAREDGTTLAQVVKKSIESMLPYMDTPAADHYII